MPGESRAIKSQNRNGNKRYKHTLYAAIIIQPGTRYKRGGVTCSLEHTKEKRAKWRIYFKNGNCRDVCGRCVKQFQAGGSSAAIVERIEKLTKKLIKDDSIKFV